MTRVTRRSLLGGAALGTVAIGATSLTACAKTGPEKYKGEVAFQHGVASGDPLPDRMILWTRVTPLSGAGPIPVRWEVLRAGQDTPVSAGMAEASETKDYCVKVDAGGLEPGSDYTYRFTALTDHGDVTSPTGRLRTPAANGSSAVHLAVVSCSNWQFGLFNAYKALAAEPNLDAVVHLGDYLYEYGIDGYGGDVAVKIGRMHEPSTEIMTLADYRQRHAQYKTDPDLQAAHAAAPWICTWDDHESANDAYRTGAQNHNPEDGEGEWSARKMAAVQAYFEWMPIRDIKPGEVTSVAWRTFRFGDVATIHALETRLTGRSESLSWSTALAGATDPAEAGAKVQAMMQTAADPARTMMGAEQENWLNGELARSVSSGAAWQVLANQVIMARVKLPNFAETLTAEQVAAQDMPEVKGLLAFTAMGLPWNLDAWDGYPAARERLYDSVSAAGARLVTLAGDTHTAYANELYDARGIRRGVEFGCTSISSPGMGAYVKAVPDLGQQIADANDEVVWHDPFGHGYTLVSLTPGAARAVFRKVSDIYSETFSTETVASYEASAEAGGVSALKPV
ncbi:alkaline phosphatase D family protein [Hyphomonas sp. WL0036]|uniref:alkaline phosphatase D family protein n=1 Tax=Hyphomonas sediminis TaxID=2866160 RepID=UPI001C7EB713|nr:alkaline phosphatase D family protein [Hyphomonas sediminis]MBY9065870.1 alkaline phosphatase D family protein [Hyphomonas sediminis]